MLFKAIILILLGFVIVSLFTAFYYLMRDPASGRRIVKTLFLRVGISLFIMLLLAIGIRMGWVVPHDFGQ